MQEVSDEFPQAKSSCTPISNDFSPRISMKYWRQDTYLVYFQVDWEALR